MNENLLALQILRAQQALEQAEREVEPILGPGPLMSYDNAGEVYAAALAAMGFDVTGVHPSGYGPIYRAYRRVGRGQKVQALDSAAFPDVARIKQL